MTLVATSIPPLPFVGRTSELAQLTAMLDGAAAGRGATVLVAGEGGVGKTRLAAALHAYATKKGFDVAIGRAYPVETGVPYALFSDALLPTLRKLDAGALQVLTRGGGGELLSLFPALAGPGREPGPPRGDAAEFKARLLWNLTQFLARLAQRRPLLIVLENLQWADASSLELLHFAARQGSASRVLIVGTYNEAERDQNPVLRSTEQSLVALGAARSLRLVPLGEDSTADLVRQAFGADAAATAEFVRLLYGWTRGNPFFVEETLKALVERGTLYQRDGRWHGWDAQALDVPGTIRDAVLERLARLSPHARLVANLAAVIGTRASYEALRSVSGLAEDMLLAAVDELRVHRVLAEAAEDGAAGSDGDVHYDFTHPILRDTLYTELGRARARALHGTVAEALEAHYEERGQGGALAHAGELAFHFARADARGLAAKAMRYLARAGRGALARYATREAADYLAAALELADRAADASGEDPLDLLEDLARARQRLGEPAVALALWERARDEAARRGDGRRTATAEGRMGLIAFWGGRYGDALAHYDRGLAAADAAGESGTAGRLRIAKGGCLLEVGRRAEAREEAETALALGERLGDGALLARAHRALMLLHAWSGPPTLAREHGRRAIELATTAGQASVAWSGHWAMAMLEGLTGNAEACAVHLGESERLADELRSPLLRLWTAEVHVEYLSGKGEWDAALAMAERTIGLARAFGQRTLLPRLLVWTSVMHLARGDVERGKRYVDEAWQLADGDGRGGKPRDVHSLVPAHAGMALYHLTVGEYARAIEIGERGLEIADRTGYVAWAIHRLLPTIGEASLWMADFERAQRYGERLRRESVQLGHKLGLAWADACDALVEMLGGSKERAIALLRTAADELDAIPFVADGARLRRQLALALADVGDRDGATRELRRVHDVFARLGAERELAATREQLRLLGARPPARVSAQGAGALTGREVEIARLVAARKSNKEIGKALGISPRTVSTHLSNVFGKLGVGSRGELTDLVRSNALPAD